MNPTPNNSFNSSTGNEDKENRLIFKALLKYKRPLTRRFISECTNLEIATLCRALFNLVHKRRLLKVALMAKCPKTGKRVYHYYFAKEGVQNGN